MHKRNLHTCHSSFHSLIHPQNIVNLSRPSWTSSFSLKLVVQLCRRGSNNLCNSLLLWPAWVKRSKWRLNVISQFIYSCIVELLRLGWTFSFFATDCRSSGSTTSWNSLNLWFIRVSWSKYRLSFVYIFLPETAIHFLCKQRRYRFFCNFLQ